MSAVDATIQRTRELLAELQRQYARGAEGTFVVRLRREDVAQLLDELVRLRAVIRETHAGCDPLHVQHGRHAPECRLYEIDEAWQAPKEGT